MEYEDTASVENCQTSDVKVIGTDYSYKHHIIWRKAIGFFTLHFFGLWGFIILCTGGVSLQTVLWGYFLTYFGSKGITIGAHKYYSHRSFKATPFLRAILIFGQTLTGQNSMFIWCRNHRQHHRYSDTDGDPHNAKRGIFFSHIGWRMAKKHPYVIELGREIDMNDLEADWMVMFQKKYYYQLYFLLAIFVPTYIPVFYFGESWWNSLLVCYFCRCVIQLHGTSWSVNSAAHLYGTRPYENISSAIASIIKVTSAKLYFKSEKSDMNAISIKDPTPKKNADSKESVEIPKILGTDYTYKHEIVWKNAIGFLIMHILTLWGLYILLTGALFRMMFLWTFFVTLLGTEGVTIGAHRYYTHKSFKASPILRAIFILFQTIAGQNSVFIWVRDHRLHHRYSDTDADPHNSKRGFFFCHIGWLMSKKHPYVIKLGRKIDMSDLQADWMVMFQKKYYYVLYFIFAVLIPVWVPVYFFNESWLDSLIISYFTRYTLHLNGAWCVNSLAHLYGTRPYDQKLQPVESWFVSMISLGEGWHNYHHAFPWDYKAAEWSMPFNQSASIIRFFEKIGLASDLKSASPEMVANRIVRTGDGSHYKLGNLETQAEITAFGPLHPLNPTFNSTLKAPDAILKPEGLPLFNENDTFDVKPPRSDSTAG